MALMSLFSFVLFFFSFPSSFGGFLPPDSPFPMDFGQTSWLFQKPPSICPRLPISTGTTSLPCICPPPEQPLVDRPAKDLLLALLSKITDLSSSISVPVDMDTSKDLLESWREKLERAPRSAGKFALHAWAFALWQFASWAWYLMTNHFLTVAVVVFLYLCTTCMVMALRFLFGGLLGFLIRYTTIMTMKAVWSCYTKAKSSSSYVKEKAVEGYLHFIVPQKPPRSSVLLVQHPDGSHVGYATCILLYNGEYGLLTAEHVRNTPGAKVVSTKGDRNKIPIFEFQQILSVAGGDLVILRGPPSWNSLLSTKAVPFTTQSRLQKGKTTLYSFDGEWKATNGEVVGTEGKFAAHLSNTSGGHSGTPLFSGKCVVGVHVGASKSNNWNLAATIPTVSGLTSPSYAFETTAPQGRVFDEAEIEYYESLVETAFEKLVNFQSKSGKNWADYSEEEDFFMEASETLPLPNPVPSAPPLSPKFYPMVDASPVAVSMVPESTSGNEQGGADRQNKASPPATPVEQQNGGPSVMDRLVAELVSKISTSSIEKEVAKQVASKMPISETPPQQPKQQRRRRRQPKTSNTTSAPSTAGKYQPPHKRSQASKPAAPSPSITTPNKRANRPGGSNSAQNSPSWRKKPEASGGPNSAPKRS
uniref:P1 n=1 Tax=Cotton leafroll dwarf virus TaxID=312295 RepID=A0A1Y0EXU3_9VIRU|nr:P1 [Cotton leafroll dwarf virus]